MQNNLNMDSRRANTAEISLLNIPLIEPLHQSLPLPLSALNNGQLAIVVVTQLPTKQKPPFFSPLQ